MNKDYHPTNKKPHECGARCSENGKSILTAPSSWSWGKIFRQY